MLQIDDLVTLGIHLEVGAQSQSVNVVSEMPLLRKDDAQTGLVIDNKRIQELPTAMRWRLRHWRRT